MKSCPRCARENEDDVRFCGRCGLDLLEYERHQTRSSEDDAKYCYRHPKEATNLSCGRCGKPICTKCAAIGPAGPRCPECAKQNIAFRPGGVMLGAKRTVCSIGRLGPCGLYLWIVVAVTVFGAVRSCNRTNSIDIESPEVSRPSSKN